MKIVRNAMAVGRSKLLCSGVDGLSVAVVMPRRRAGSSTNVDTHFTTVAQLHRYHRPISIRTRFTKDSRRPLPSTWIPPPIEYLERMHCCQQQ